MGTGFSFNPLNGLVRAISYIEASLIPVLIGAALLVFFYGLVRYLFNAAGDAKLHDKEKGVMIWGLITLFIMVSVWGIIKIGQNAFGMTGRETIIAPAIPATRGL